MEHDYLRKIPMGQEGQKSLKNEGLRVWQKYNSFVFSFLSCSKFWQKPDVWEKSGSWAMLQIKVSTETATRGVL